MLLLLTASGYTEIAQEAINREHRLNELVTITEDPDTLADIVINETIRVHPDWKNTQPPVLFPDIPFSAEVLLGLLYAKLGNYEKAYPLLLTSPVTLAVVDLLNRIQSGALIENVPDAGVEHINLHNQAIALHYGNWNREVGLSFVKQSYEAALQFAPGNSETAFTAKQYAQLLLDTDSVREAVTLLERISELDLPQQARMEIKYALCAGWMQQLQAPYETEGMELLKERLWECLNWYEKQQRHPETAMVLYDAAFIAQISKSYSEALGYINRAISVFEQESLKELHAQAQLRKAGILKAWAQSGNPQFFRSAMQAYQQALLVFTRDASPEVFADIQHQLGIVYAEIPDEVKKKGVWAAVSVASFNEALDYYNKVDYPYEFGRICNSLGNAYTRYPASLHSDNFDKALAWYREALEVQHADLYPNERAITLINYLDAGWLAGYTEQTEKERYVEMLAKAREVLSLTHDTVLQQSAREHLNKLEELKPAQVSATPVQ